MLLELVGDLRVPIGLFLLAAVNGRMGARDDSTIALAQKAAGVLLSRNGYSVRAHLGAKELSLLDAHKCEQRVGVGAGVLTR